MNSKVKVAATSLVKELFNGNVPQDSRDTPRRFAEYLAEFCAYRDKQLADVLGAGFSHSGSSMVIQRDIAFKAVCAHHLLPFFGRAAIGYVPNGKVVGLSKLARLVCAAGQQGPSMQETITQNIADALHEGIKAMGVIVVVEAAHTCMTIRGIADPAAKTITSCVKGIFRDVPAAREEFLSLSKG